MLKICEECGKEFETKSDKKCCSNLCYCRRYRKNDKKQKETAKCIVCGKEFQKIRKTHYCCSKECSIKNDKAKQRARMKKFNEKKQQNKVMASQKAKSLAEVNAEARKLGLTYGQYEMQKRLGKC